AARLITAPECPSGERTIILDGGQLALQVHESIGHPIELDRVLGLEAGFAGTSFLKPSDAGKLRYASEFVNVSADATTPGGLGTFGWDDEGVPAQRTDVIREGIFRGFLSSRETAGAVGRNSSGAMRASGWHAIPLIRMTNVNLLPGLWDLEGLIADTADGLLLATNRSWSIDDKRLNFQFGCEIAWEIVDGKLGRVYRNPTYMGITPQFWASCDAVCGPADWRMWGTPNCGKGEPMQTAHVGHGAAPARFRGVRVGVMK
ncbi:MAG TPA: TldD/PmbA family protein, partial [Planctomycetota bacterium]|nr:TldD/PmbA family protein [Planctomycetota bacterium]